MLAAGIDPGAVLDGSRRLDQCDQCGQCFSDSRSRFPSIDASLSIVAYSVNLYLHFRCKETRAGE
jgi:hypothetical protein